MMSLMQDAKKTALLEVGICILVIAGFIASALMFAAKPIYDVVKHVFK